MTQALYRKHRSKSFKEVVGQEHITTALERALAKGTMAHAYLFTGPRGTGKTSIARILAHVINDLPYDDDRLHLDIIEIDAASNRRIDEIRDLRDKVHIAPTSAKYKVYIIDEVHMLTKEAFNALLKTLEEPPAHVVFILATTEVHKLPETIISRTQRFAFKPVELAKVTAHLKQMAKKEGIKIDDDALALVAAHGEGSFRDSISLLDQVRNSGEAVTLQTVQDLLGIAPDEIIDRLYAAIAEHDVVAASEQLASLREQGAEAGQIAKQLSVQLREQLLGGKSPLGSDVVLKLLGALVGVPASADPRASLEIAVLDAALSGKPSAPKTVSAEVMTKPATQVADQTTKFIKQSRQHKEAEEEIGGSDPSSPAKQDESPKAVAHAPADDSPNPATSSTDLLDNAAWATVLGAIKQKYNTLYGLLNASRPHFSPGKVTLECAYAFHKKRLNEAKNKQIIASTITELAGANVAIVCEMGSAPRSAQAASLPPAGDEHVRNLTPSAPAKPPQNQAVSAISNIFGGAEVLE